jgi:hypothetical protein
VDDVFVPHEISAYAPYVVSAEHGLFTWGGYHGVWHHFLPHYWGANSEWLDTRELIPHRRPQCLAEDQAGHLWVGTEGDGIVRMNAHARRFNERSPESNEQTGDEFARFAADEIGCEPARVNDIAPGLERGVWTALVGNDKRRYIGRFDGSDWSLFELPKIERRTSSGQTIVKTVWWEATPLSLCEVSSGRILVGVEDAVWPAGLFELNWEQREFQEVAEVEHEVHNIERAADGSIWAQTWWGIYRWKGE